MSARAKVLGVKQLLAEFLGTMLLLSTVVGSGIMAERLAGGNMALALLGNTLPTGAMLVVIITMFGPISGAHFNPAVTLIAWLQNALTARTAVAYCLMQVAGALSGVVIAHLMFEMPVFEFSQKVRTGSGQWIAEAVATFGLVTTILATLRARPSSVAVSVGLYIVAAYWFTASTAFANPAVTLARSLTDSFAGIRLIDAPGFIVAQTAGALAALLVCRAMFGKDPQPSAEVVEPA